MYFYAVLQSSRHDVAVYDVRRSRIQSSRPLPNNGIQYCNIWPLLVQF